MLSFLLPINFVCIFFFFTFVVIAVEVYLWRCCLQAKEEEVRLFNKLQVLLHTTMLFVGFLAAFYTCFFFIYKNNNRKTFLFHYLRKDTGGDRVNMSTVIHIRNFSVDQIQTNIAAGNFGASFF